MKKLIIIALLLAVAATAAWWFVLRDTGDAEPRILATTTVELGDVRRVLEATGIIKSQVGAIVKIGARATGTIEKMLVKIGDAVAKGDLIAVIDDRELQAQRDEAEARLVRNEAELERVREVFPLEINEAEAQLDLAQARKDYAQKTLSRQRELVRRKVQAADFLDQAQRDLDVAENEVAARRATLRRLKAAFVREEAKSIKDVLESKAELTSIDVRISYTRIESPIDGQVSLVAAQEGETVVSGLQVSNLITVIDPTRLEMWIYVDETDVGQVKPGMEVDFRVDAYRDQVFRSVIDQIYPEPEIRDNIVYYRALVPVSPEQARLLRPEMTTQCQIVVEEKDGVPALPNEALKWVGDRQVVFVQRGGGVQEISPKLGLQGLNKSEILEGLEPGDVVATQVVLPKSAASASGRPTRGGG